MAIKIKSSEGGLWVSDGEKEEFFPRVDEGSFRGIPVPLLEKVRAIRYCGGVWVEVDPLYWRLLTSIRDGVDFEVEGDEAFSLLSLIYRRLTPGGERTSGLGVMANRGVIGNVEGMKVSVLREKVCISGGTYTGQLIGRNGANAKALQDALSTIRPVEVKVSSGRDGQSRLVWDLKGQPWRHVTATRGQEGLWFVVVSPQDAGEKRRNWLFLILHPLANLRPKVAWRIEEVIPQEKIMFSFEGRRVSLSGRWTIGWRQPSFTLVPLDWEMVAEGERFCREYLKVEPTIEALQNMKEKEKERTQ